MEERLAVSKVRWESPLNRLQCAGGKAQSSIRVKNNIRYLDDKT